MTVFELCNQAIVLVRGKRLVLTAEERTALEALDCEGLANLHAQDEAVVCAMNFERVRDRLLQLYAWTFARRYAAIISGQQLPNDCLAVLYALAGQEPTEYDVYGGYISVMTAEGVEICYTSRQDDVSTWPPIFCDVFAYSLAIEICPAVTGKPEYMQALEQKAQELLHRAQQIGAIKAETRLTLKEELYNRAIGLARGTRTLKETSTAATEQGTDNAGFVNDRMTAEYQACVRASESVRDRLLGLYAWRFARKRAVLETSANAAWGWKFAYKLPDDCLKILSLHSHNAPFDGEPDDYEETGDVVYCNEMLPEVRYTAKTTDMNLWPGVFRDVYCYSLAAEIVLAVTDNGNASQLLEAKAQNLIQEAQRLGEIRAESNIPAGDELYNRAIALVRGVRTVSPSSGASVEQGADFTGDVSYREREAIAVCRRSMPELRDKLLRLYAWKFAKTATTAGQASPEPSTRGGWSYEYGIPGECIKLLAVLDGDVPIEYEEVGTDKILCNASGGITLRYIKRVEDTTQFDPVFKEVLCYELAEEISAVLTWNPDNISLLEQKKQAVIQNAYRTGIIQEETRIPLKQELFNRAISLAHGVRTLKPSADNAVAQGVDSYGFVNDRNNAEIQVCRRSSESVRDKLLQLYPWVFARKSAVLSSTQTVSGWDNGYVLPSDCLNVLAVLCDGEAVDFEVINDRVYCNGENASARYTARAENMNEWPSGFADAFCYELAEEIISATTASNEGVAVLEQKKQALIVDAYKTGTIKTEMRIPVKLELFNRAIGLVKGLKTEKPDILDTRYEDEISACRRGHDSIRDRLLQSYAWVFARKTDIPARLSESVPGWRYTYILPEDCLKVSAVIAQDKRAGMWDNACKCVNVSEYPETVELADWESAGKELYANRDVVYVRYIARIDDYREWAAAFTEAFVILLAIEVALNVVGDKNIITVLEQRLARIIEDARTNGLILEETRLPVQRDTQRIGNAGRMYLDYSGIPTWPCGDKFGRRMCDAGELCNW